MTKKRHPEIETVPLAELDWNFERVQDAELAACCYWEYARESAFILEARRRATQNWRNGVVQDAAVSAALASIHGSGPAMEVILKGFHFPPDELHRIDLGRDAGVPGGNVRA